MPNALNLLEIDQEQALNLTKFFIRSKKNIFFFGQKGIGKTHIAIQAAQECNYKISYINLSVIERPDLAGYPNVMDTGDTITFKSATFLPALLEDLEPDTVLLFDEVDKAPTEVTAPLLEILQYKTVNGKPLNIVSCILTGNLTNEHAFSNQISVALLDRGAKYILSFNFEKWIEWAKANNVHDLIVGFLRNNTEFACGQLEDSCYASPSPRGWTLASEALFKAKELKIVDIETITHIISGFVGHQAGLRFQIWYEYYRKFEPFIHSLIDSGVIKYDFVALNPTEKLVFVVSACYHAKQKLFDSHASKERFVYLENLCQFFIDYQVESELQVMGLYNSFDFEMITKHKLYQCKKFFNLFNELCSNTNLKK